MTDYNVNEELIDTVIRYAAAKQVDEIAAKYSGEDLPAHNFSKDFNRRMKSFFASKVKKSRSRKIGKWALCACAAMFILMVVSAVTIYSVDAFRVPVLNFLQEISGESTTFYATESSDYSAFEDELHGMYVPRYIPEGYMINGVQNRNVKFLEYVNKSGNQIRLTNIKENSTLSLDNEEVGSQIIKVHGEDARSFENEGVNYLLFRFDKHTFLLAGSVDKEELLKIAQSLHYVK